MTPGVVVAVAAGGFLGAPARYLVDRTITQRFESEFPWGTLVVNVSGALLLGLLTGITLAGHLPELAKAVLATGFCGAYTTFSTFSFETVALVEEGLIAKALGNVALSVAVGLGAAAAGVAIGLSI